jgi:hypothetical protein
VNERWWIGAAIVASSQAHAQPVTSAAPVQGSSSYVVPYQPPAVTDPAHHGFTLELAAGLGTTSVDRTSGGASVAIGGWLAHDVSLAFRVTAVGAFGFAGGALQYYAMPTLWASGGVGLFSERVPDSFGGTLRNDGSGGFVRLGYNLGQSGVHALYVSGEIQGGIVADETRAVAIVSVGYQLL